VIYLGRKEEIAEQIRESLTANYAYRNGAGPVTLEFIQVTSQKQAGEEIRETPPHGVIVEISNGRFSRKRFTGLMRQRLPLTKLIAVKVKNAQPVHEPSSPEFDAVIQDPAAPREAITALDALLDKESATYLTVGELQLDVAMSRVIGPTGEHHLAPKLCRLLQILMQNVGKTISRDTLMQEVWLTEFVEDTRTLDVHIRWLRERIEPRPSRPAYLFTMRGEGYRLEDPFQA
jgi:DNA-binding response OmpR family regulator